jgi:hypothetical protein
MNPWTDLAWFSVGPLALLAAALALYVAIRKGWLPFR